MFQIWPSFWPFSLAVGAGEVDTARNRCNDAVGKKNISAILKRRFQDIHTEYELALQSQNWKTMRHSGNVSIETMEPADGWPIYIKTTAYFPINPTSLYEIFKWKNFDTTQKAIDPFYESSGLIFEPSKDIKVVYKRTKRPLIYPKRQFIIALKESTQSKGFSFHPMANKIGSVNNPRSRLATVHH